MCKQTAAPDMTENCSLKEGLGLDVTGLILFAVAVEDNYDIRFNNAEDIETVGDMIEYILTEKGR